MKNIKKRFLFSCRLSITEYYDMIPFFYILWLFPPTLEVAFLKIEFPSIDEHLSHLRLS